MDFIFTAAKICAGLVDKIRQDLTTLKYVAKDLVLLTVITREEVFMEGPLEPNMGPSLADVPGFLHFL